MIDAKYNFKTIDTAPLDGTAILVMHREKGRPIIVSWDAVRSSWRADGTDLYFSHDYFDAWLELPMWDD